MRHNRYGNRFSSPVDIHKQKIIDATSIRNKYVGFYNETVKESNPLTAFSNLSQSRIEIERKRDKLIERIEEFLDQIRHLTQEEEEDNIEIEKAKFSVSQSMIPTFPYNLHLTHLETEKEKLINQLQRLYDLKNSTLNSSLIERVNKAYKNKNELEIIVTHLNSIDAITDKIVENDYPEKLSDFTEEELEEELLVKELKEESKAGRKLDESAPQEPIEEKVKELIQIKRFLDENGNPKPTTIRDELINNHSHLVGELSDRTVFRRVKRALENMT